ncbi:solute carrier family 35 member G1-like [Glandiceps talaboti]
MKRRRKTKAGSTPEERAQQTMQPSATLRATGLILAFAAGMSVSCTSVVVKLVKDDLSFWEVTFYRGLMNSILVYSYLVVNGRGNLLKDIDGKIFGTVMLRSLFFVTSVTISFAVNQNIPLGDASALMGTSTVMTGFLGIFILNEKWHITEMLLSLLCWAGVVLISRPAFLMGATEGAAVDDGGVRAFYSMLALCAALTTTLSFLFVRKIGGSLDVPRLVLASEFTSMVCCFSILLYTQGGVSLPPENTLRYLPALSLTSTMVQVLMGASLRIEKAASAVVCRTAGLVITSFILQSAVFHTIPEITSLAGAGLILTSTAFLSWRKLQEKPKRS